MVGRDGAGGGLHCRSRTNRTCGDPDHFGPPRGTEGKAALCPARRGQRSLCSAMTRRIRCSCRCRGRRRGIGPMVRITVTGTQDIGTEHRPRVTVRLFCRNQPSLSCDAISQVIRHYGHGHSLVQDRLLQREPFVVTSSDDRHTGRCALCDGAENCSRHAHPARPAWLNSEFFRKVCRYQCPPYVTNDFAGPDRRQRPLMYMVVMPLAIFGHRTNAGDDGVRL